MASRWLLEQTLDMVDEPLRPWIERRLDGRILAKPQGFKGDERSDMFALWSDVSGSATTHLSDADVAQINDIAKQVHSACTAALQKEAVAHRLRGFDEAWQEILLAAHTLTKRQKDGA